ncbi:MAG: hypothetical protein ACTSWP_04660 [Candidatus Freyarchaeota archaeon]|nr:hypothetical protein [Candidatus Freyrarchaeum guaymaensis]
MAILKGSDRLRVSYSVLRVDVVVVTQKGGNSRGEYFGKEWLRRLEWLGG